VDIIGENLATTDMQLNCIKLKGVTHLWRYKTGQHTWHCTLLPNAAL